MNINEIMIIINLQNKKTILMIPRTSLILTIYEYLKNYNIELYNKKSSKIAYWYYPIGVFLGIINENYIELDINITKDKIITLDKKIAIQHRLKQGFATIFNSTKKFVDILVSDIEDYMLFCLLLKKDEFYETKFFNFIKKIYNNQYTFNIPFAICNNDNINFFVSKYKSNMLLNDLFNNFNIELLNKMKINGIEYNVWKNIPIDYALIYMCNIDLFLYFIYP